MSGQSALFAPGRIWVVRLGAGGPAYWFSDARLAERYARAHGKPSGNFIFPAEPGDAA